MSGSIVEQRRAKFRDLQHIVGPVGYLPAAPGVFKGRISETVADESISKKEKIQSILFAYDQAPTRAIDAQNIRYLFLSLSHLARNTPDLQAEIKRSPEFRRLCRATTFVQDTGSCEPFKFTCGIIKSYILLGLTDERLARYLCDNFVNALWTSTVDQLNLLMFWGKKFVPYVQQNVSNRFFLFDDRLTKKEFLALRAETLSLLCAQVNEGKLFSPVATDTLCAAATDRVAEISLGAIATLLSIAQGEDVEELLARLCSEIAELKPDELGVALSGLARVGAHDGEKYQQIATQIVKFSEEWDAEDAGKFITAFTSHGGRDFTLLRKIGDNAVISCPTISFSAAAAILRGFIVANVEHDPIFIKIAEAMKRQVATNAVEFFDKNSFVSIAWAYAAANFIDDELCTLIVNEARQIWNHLDLYQQSVLLWSTIIMSPKHARDLRGLPLNRDIQQLITPQTELRLHQVDVILGLVAPDEISENLTTHMAQEARLQEKHGFNGLEAEVNSALEHIASDRGDGFGFRSQGSVGGIPIDFMVVYNDAKLIIECDGDKHHRLGGKSTGRMLGKDVIQDRMFRALGYRVLHINHKQWNRWKHDSSVVDELEKAIVDRL